MRFEYLNTAAEIEALIQHHNEHSPFVCLDTETTSKDPREATLLDIQLTGYDENHVVMFAGEHAPLLLKLTPTQVIHNFKYDWKVLARHGADLRGKPVIDTIILHHLLDENLDHDLDSIVQARFHDNYKETFWGKYGSYQEASFEDRLDYACKDVWYLYKVYSAFVSELRGANIPDSLVTHIHRLALALYSTEIDGVELDLQYVVQLGTELQTDIQRTQTELRRLGGVHCEIIELREWAKAIEKAYRPTGKKWRTLPKPEFNFGSQKQVIGLLYNELKLPPVLTKCKITKKLRPTVDDDALEQLENKHALIPELRKLRKYSKMHGAFIDGVMDLAEGHTIYPQFNVTGTSTGRVSHSSPNMAQMPSKGEWAKIRGIFIPRPGTKLVTCDFGMLEVCVAAHFSLDKNLLKIINEGASKHDITAESLGVPRGTAKTLNFALQYQCGPRKVAEIIGCTQKEGQFYWNKYWETYAGEKVVIDACKANVNAGLPITSPFGRQRHFPKTFANEWERDAAHRQAYSALVQGTGSDLTSYSFYVIAEWLAASKLGRALFTVHDELVVEAVQDCVEDVRAKVIEVMEGSGAQIALKVPLTVSCSEGLARWQK